MKQKKTPKPPKKRTDSKDKDKVKGVPKTLENMRKPDPTTPTCPEEISACFDNDEFSSWFKEKQRPNIVVTTIRKAHKKTIAFAAQFATLFGGTGGPLSSDGISLPPARFLPRKAHHTLDVIIEETTKASCTDLIVIGERLKEPYSLTIVHLPHGPTAYFRLSSVKMSKEIGKNLGSATPHPPELNMANFNTVLGMTVGRFLTSLFPWKPQFHGRQVVTFHNQRDFIFFRRHRYIFRGVEGGEDEASGTPSVRMQELGPRFTLKLQAIQKGTFDQLNGEYIWLRVGKDMKTRKDFYC